MQLSDLELPDMPEWVTGEAPAAEVVPFRRPAAAAKPKADPIAKAIQRAPAAKRKRQAAAAPPELADVLMQAIRAARARRGRVTQAQAAREAALIDVLRELIGGVR